MRQVSRQDVFVPHYTAARQYREACRSVVREASLVVEDRQRTDESYLRQAFPAMATVPDPNKAGLEHAIAAGFTPILENKRFTILRRDPSVAVACDWAGG